MVKAKPSSNLLILCLGVCALACAQDQTQEPTRAGQIEAARNQKEANLTPEEPPKTEERLEWIENSFPYRLLTGEVDGFGLGFGTIIPGSGFAIRPRYTRSGLWDGRVTVRVEGLAAANESYMGRLDVSMPHLFNDLAFVDFNTTHLDISEMPYYGPGPDSRKTGRSDYRLETTNVELRPGIRIHKGLRASLIGSYLAVNVGRGHSDDYISTDLQYGPSAAPGIDNQTDFWRGGALVEYDWRDNPSSPASGGKYSAQYLGYLDQNLGRYSFLRLDLDAWQFIPLFNRTHVIALHGASSLTTTNSTQQVPFYLQPMLGGPDTLRGYRFDRFYGNNSTLLTAEYRWDASPILQMVVFADGGKVFNTWGQWNFHDIQSDVGFGLRFKSVTRRTVFRLDTGFSHEGFQIWFGLNNIL